MSKTRPYLLVLWFIGLVSIPMSMVPAQVFNYLTGVLQAGSSPRFSSILPIILLYFLCRSGIAFLDVVRTMVNGVYLEQSTREFTLKVFSRVLRISPDFFRRHDPARIANRVIADTRTVKSFWLGLSVSVPVSALGLLAYAYVLFFGLSRDTPLAGVFLGGHTQVGSWFLGTLILVMAPIQSYFVLFDKKIQEINREAAAAGDEIVTRAHETIAGVAEIRANNAFDYAMERVGKAFAGYRDVQIRMTKLSAFFSGAGPMINALVNCILLAIGARLCLGPLHIPGIGLAIEPIRWQDYLGFTFMAMAVHGYIGSLLRFYLRWRMTRETIRRVDEYVKSPLVFCPDDSAPDLDPAQDSLTFDGVDFETALGNRILGDLHIRVRSGERLAFAGPSGSGKSTAMNLVTRELSPTGGSLAFGDKPVERINFESLAREVALVPQKPMLFDMSIRDNILLSLRRPCGGGIEDGGWTTDVSRLAGVRDTADLDRVLLTVVEQVGLSEDLGKKGLDNSCPANRAECSSIIGRAPEICRAVSERLSRNPDMVV
ncbi:MAG: ABC transporter ATP-binding protein, partial [Pseudomonadota bacterium]